ncbi:MAG: CRTAC1 family protein [Opitutaceae bacterium]
MRIFSHLFLRVVSAAILAPAWYGCRNPAPPAARGDAGWFTDVTETVGVDFRHDCGPVADYFMPANIGSGLAMLDYDNDGRLDLYFIQNAGEGSPSRNRLFHQTVDGHFADASAGSGLDIAGRGMGVAIGDVDNDGACDVVVTQFGSVRLLRNEGGGKFREIVDSGLRDPLWAVSACFLDYDRDGWLDLVIGNYLAYDPHRVCFDESGQRDFCGPQTFPGGTVAKLFHNRAGSGAPRFEDVTVPSGLGSVRGSALGVAVADFDGDGWPDIFLANDGEPNRLWINEHAGTFHDEALQRGVAVNGMGRPQGNMGVALSDVNGDNTFDLFVTHLIEETHALWGQSPRGLFQDRTGTSGIARPRWHATGFGTVLEDFDNDGAPDAAVVNGAVRRNRLRKPDAATVAANGEFWAPYAERNQLFANNGRGEFRDVSEENAVFCGTARVARGLVAGDLDNDGAVDVVVSNIGNRARVYRNTAPNRGNWLSVRAIDPALGGRDAYGAVVTVVAASRSWTRWCNPGSSFASSNDPRAHFGLGTLTNVDAIEVHWPDGTGEMFSGGGVNRFLVLRKGEGTTKLP